MSSRTGQGSWAAELWHWQFGTGNLLGGTVGAFEPERNRATYDSELDTMIAGWFVMLFLGAWPSLAVFPF
jgi:hypothetical protein